MEAYVLIDAEPGIIWELAKTTLKIKGVRKAHAVAGQYDAIVYVEFTKMDDLGKIIEKIQQLKGVRRTQTLIAIPPTIEKQTPRNHSTKANCPFLLHDYCNSGLQQSLDSDCSTRATEAKMPKP